MTSFCGLPLTTFIGIAIYECQLVRLDGDNDTWLETGAVPWYGPDSTPFHEITGLDRTKKYEMKTVAVNGDWRSEASDVETVTPGIEIGIARKYTVLPNPKKLQLATKITIQYKECFSVWNFSQVYMYSIVA